MIFVYNVVCLPAREPLPGFSGCITVCIVNREKRKLIPRTSIVYIVNYAKLVICCTLDARLDVGILCGGHAMLLRRSRSQARDELCGVIHSEACTDAVIRCRIG